MLQRSNSSLLIEQAKQLLDQASSAATEEQALRTRQQGELNQRQLEVEYVERRWFEDDQQLQHDRQCLAAQQARFDRVMLNLTQARTQLQQEKAKFEEERARFQQARGLGSNRSKSSSKKSERVGTQPGVGRKVMKRSSKPLLRAPHQLQTSSTMVWHSDHLCVLSLPLALTRVHTHTPPTRAQVDTGDVSSQTPSKKSPRSPIAPHSVLYAPCAGMCMCGLARQYTHVQHTKLQETGQKCSKPSKRCLAHQHWRRQMARSPERLPTGETGWRAPCWRVRRACSSVAALLA